MGVLVFDFKDLIEQIIFCNLNFIVLFNVFNIFGIVVQKNCSDDKGLELEGVVIVEINGNYYLFVLMECIGGVMVFNIDNLVNFVYFGYYNNCMFVVNGFDCGVEGIIFILVSQLLNGYELLILVNEVSFILFIYQVNICVELVGGVVSIVDVELCVGEIIIFIVSGVIGFSF